MQSEADKINVESFFSLVFLDVGTEGTKGQSTEHHINCINI